MAKDWIGNKKSTFVTLGASNHTDKERQREDYYATDPIAARLLLDVEPFEGKIWECACGEKHLGKGVRLSTTNRRKDVSNTQAKKVLWSHLW